jgi:hypothetical protein
MHEISLGYLKDVLAFVTAIIFFILYVYYDGFNMKLCKVMLLIIFILIFVFDGVFTFFSSLHNYKINP